MNTKYEEIIIDDEEEVMLEKLDFSNKFLPDDPVVQTKPKLKELFERSPVNETLYESDWFSVRDIKQDKQIGFICLSDHSEYVKVVFLDDFTKVKEHAVLRAILKGAKYIYKYVVFDDSIKVVE